MTTATIVAAPLQQRHVTRRALLTYLGLACAAVLLFVVGSATGGQTGFPLDDGWIHQTFARALGWRGEWAYNPGQWVAGSTSPLWTLLLTPPYLLWHGTTENPVDGSGLLLFQGWAYLLGAMALGVAAAETDAMARRAVLWLWPSVPAQTLTRAGWTAGLLCVLEWRLVWAAASGMETMLFIALMLWLLGYITRLRDRVRRGEAVRLRAWAALGAGIGLLALVRPEGIVLAAFGGGEVVLAYGLRNVRRWLRAGGVMLLGLLLPIVPDALFNMAVSGSPLPTTFYAKSSAYAASSIGGMLAFLISPDPAAGALAVLLRGPVVLVAPGVLVAAWAGLKEVKGRQLSLLSLWPAALLLLYAVRLPQTYQHGRYLMPLIGFVVAWGVAGGVLVLRWLRRVRLRRLAAVIPLLVAFGWLFGGANGLQSYYYDVKFFNVNQVQVGRWLRDNTPPGTQVATHDIGAIGYIAGYGTPGDPRGHIIVDTAGLISPTYVPIVRDEMRIRHQLEQDGVAYLAMLPGWYATLGTQLEAAGRTVYTPPPADTGLSPDLNMRVYRLR